MLRAMDAMDFWILSVILALGLGRFLQMRDMRRAPSQEQAVTPRKLTPMRITARVLLGYAYLMAALLMIRFLVGRA
ncbi:hypothetical protein D7Y13_14655 [Corallococcus praedator]|uniref:Uncharacterized protein n=1 Tax=Corallococcus praedator TaxID=2316724 RepID=A0ABX9QKP0_9BACT|nr:MULTISPECIES: hypothetical protein [Corallococcus]RKH34314.1 hypothetical protein D7X75_08860 [Corallococcus sp. CA031C]RKI09286.1 hypothetical protein D7Y13_14655 [Corallococcus praedator]